MAIASLVRPEDLAVLVQEMVRDELNSTVDDAVDKILEALKPQIKERVATKIIAQTNGSFDIMRMRDQYSIRIDVR